MIDHLRELLQNSENIIFFGGAGVSTESGIPDFRSEIGIYQSINEYGYPPEVILSHQFFYENPKIFFEFYREKMVYPTVKPNAAHRALQLLENQGKLKGVVTQNIDGLHQMAGSINVLELHGSIHRNYCVRCGKAYALKHVMHVNNVPECDECGGIIKPDVVLYGEPLRSMVIEQSIKLITEADVLIIGGTSLTVYPAAGLIEYYRGNKMVVINKSATNHDRDARIVIKDNIGKILEKAVVTGRGCCKTTNLRRV